MTLGSTCKHCVYFDKARQWCGEWERAVHPNRVQCDRFLSLSGEQPEERPFAAMFSVTITPDSQSAAYGGGPTMRKRQIPDERFDEALRLREQDDLSPKDIASKMGVSTNRVKYMLAEARRRRGSTDADATAPENAQGATAPTEDAQPTAAPEDQADVELPQPVPASPGPDVSELTRSLNALGRIVERLDGRVEKLEDAAEDSRDRIEAVAHAAARELQVIRESVEALRRDVEQLRHEFMRHGHIWPSGDVALPILGRETA